MHEIRILHVITGLRRAGAEISLLNLLRSLEGRQFTAMVVTLQHGGAYEAIFRQHGIRLETLEVQGLTGLLAAPFRLLRILNEFRPHIVQSWLYHADFVATLAHFIQSAPRLVWSLRNSDLREESRKDWNLIVRILARYSKRVDMVISNSAAGVRDHRSFGYQPRAWQVIRNGWDVPDRGLLPDLRLKARAELAIADDEIAVMMPARWAKQKDYPTYLRACQIAGARDRRLKFFAAGAGHEIDMEAMIGSVPELTYIGERADLAMLIPGFDAIALSSAYGEGCSNALGEAMAAGVPVIATDVGDAGQIIGATGMIVPPRNPDALAEAFLAFAAKSAAERTALGQAAYQRIADEFSVARVHEHYRRVYLELLGVNGGAGAQETTP